MVTPTARSLAAALYGLAVLGGGVGRYLWLLGTTGGGVNGLWFGLVMGSVALLGALLMGLGRQAVGRTLVGLAVLFVGGWFGYEIVGKGAAELRVYFMLALSLIMAGVLLLPTRQTAGEPSAPLSN